MTTVQLKRVYDAPAATDGRRVLVDRLWPRGISRERAAIDDWLREIAPSTELRTWYRHRPEGAAEFSDRYRGELAHGSAADALSQLKTWAAEGPVTLITSTRALDLSHAALLQRFLACDQTSQRR